MIVRRIVLIASRRRHGQNSMYAAMTAAMEKVFFSVVVVVHGRRWRWGGEEETVTSVLHFASTAQQPFNVSHQNTVFIESQIGKWNC